MILHSRLDSKVHFSGCLKVYNMLDSLTVADNLCQMVGVEKLKERLLKLAVLEGLTKDSDARAKTAQWLV